MPNRSELAGSLDSGAGGDAAAIAQEYQAVVSLFGHIATPDGRAWRDESADVGLGTSGSGDVLTGIIAGLLSRGADAAQAACWGTFAHAASGLRLIPRFGRIGFLARDLLDEIPRTFATV